MTILAFEFSSARRSVAVARAGKVLAEAAEENSARATNAFALIEKVLAKAKILREEIEVIALGLGPGSYTGIRATIALARGWQLAREVKLAGVSSAEALALQAQTAKFFGRVNIVIDAQRGEFYHAQWEISETMRREISPLKIVSAAEINSAARAQEVWAGPAMQKNLFPGAAEIARLAMEQNGADGAELEPIYLRLQNFVKSCR